MEHTSLGWPTARKMLDLLMRGHLQLLPNETALYLGELEEFGTVEEGKRADLVLLEGNPLEDITNARRIDGVMVRGRWYTQADPDVMLEKVAKANQE